MSWIPTFNDLAKIFTTSSDNSYVGAMVIKDKTPESSGFVFKVSGIGYTTGLAIELPLTGKSLTSYRFKPDADMRVAEDATDSTEAETWLQIGAALANGQFFCRPVALANEWSDWRDFPESDYLTNLWFSTDAAGTGKTAVVECE